MGSRIVRHHNQALPTLGLRDTMPYFISSMRTVDQWKKVEAKHAKAVETNTLEIQSKSSKSSVSKSADVEELLRFLEDTELDINLMTRLPTIEKCMDQYWETYMANGNEVTMNHAKLRAMYVDIAHVLVDGKSERHKANMVTLVMKGNWTNWRASDKGLDRFELYGMLFQLAHCNTPSTVLGEYVEFLNKTIAKIREFRSKKAKKRPRKDVNCRTAFIGKITLPGSGANKYSAPLARILISKTKSPTKPMNLSISSRTQLGSNHSSSSSVPTIGEEQSHNQNIFLSKFVKSHVPSIYDLHGKSQAIEGMMKFAEQNDLSKSLTNLHKQISDHHSLLDRTNFDRSSSTISDPRVFFAPNSAMDYNSTIRSDMSNMPRFTNKLSAPSNNLTTSHLKQQEENIFPPLYISQHLNRARFRTLTNSDALPSNENRESKLTESLSCPSLSMLLARKSSVVGLNGALENQRQNQYETMHRRYAASHATRVKIKEDIKADTVTNRKDKCLKQSSIYLAIATDIQNVNSNDL